MKSYRTLALKELLSQKVTSILILIAVVLLAYLVQCGNSRPSLSEETDMPLFCR